jgi:drug/metabolite transporter (DMT)-like permease
MNTAIGCAFGAMFFFGIGDLIYKRGSTAGARPHHFLMVQSWIFLPSVVLYGFVTNALGFTGAVLWGCMAGLFMTVGFYNVAYSLKSGSISINAPVFRLSFVITTLLAVCRLRETLKFYKVGAIACALLAVWILLGAPAGLDTSPRHANRASLMRVLVATVSVGIGNVIYKFGLRAGATPASLIIAQALVVVTLSTALVASTDRRIRPPGVTLRYAPAAAIVLALAFGFLVEGLVRGDASVVVPIAQTGFGVTAAIGFLFLHEPFTLRKGAGLIAALVALATFAYGQSPM